MATKFVVTKVTVRREASVSNYLAKGGDIPALKELLLGVGNMKNWVCTVAGGKVTAASPNVDGHPGHVAGSDWKLNIERGNGSVDRLYLKQRKYTVTPNKSNKDQMNVEISCNAFVETNTH